MANLAQLIADGAARQPERPAFRLGEIVLDYAAMDEASARAAALLAERGVGVGDRVALSMPNLPYFPIVYYGALRLGAVVLPLNPLLKEREVAYHLSDAGARLLLAWQGFADAGRGGSEAAGAECLVVEPGRFEALLGAVEPARAVVERDPQDVAVLVYTSGTTGQPKGAELTHANLLDAARVAVELVHSGPESVVLGALPLFHVFGMCSGMNATMYAGGSMTLQPRFEAGEALQIIERDAVNILLGVPTMYTAMLHHPDHDARDTSTLDLCVSGGAALPVQILRSFEETFGCKILEGYGLTETCGMASFNRPDRERKPGSIGLPVDGAEMRLVDDDDHDVPLGEVGEILIRSPHVMRGYWGHPEATAEAMRGGWFHTGDLARMDDGGYYFIVDRKKDLIIRGGYNVYPREVEEILYEHPAVRDAAVIGIPDESLGEEVAAVVTLRPGRTATEDELIAFVKNNVAAYKYPRHVWIVDELPLGPTGKVLKRALRIPEVRPAAAAD